MHQLLKTLLFLVITTGTLNAQTITDIVVNSPDHNTLEAAVIAAGLDDDLAAPGTFTLFAPTDEAFEALGSLVDTLLQDPMGELRDILLYHVLDEVVPSSDLANGAIVTPLNDQNTLKITITRAGEPFVNHAFISMVDIPADNGIVHVIDAVVLPVETVVDVAIDNGFNTLTTAVVAAELLPALTNPAESYTVFAPADSAFDQLGTLLDDLLMDTTGALANILLYHTMDGEVPSSAVTNGLIADALNTQNTLKFTRTRDGARLFVNQAEITIQDVGAANGVVHAIDAVILPSETVVDAAIDNGFTTLTTAVVNTRLTPALSDPSLNITVMAPTDSAFALINGLDQLLMDTTGQLQNILLYHVLLSEVFEADIQNGQIVGTALNPATLKLTRTSADDLIFANQAQVVLADVDVDNGVVHAINDILVPNSTVVDIAIANDFNTLVTAVAEAELLPILTNPFLELTVFAPTEDAFTALGTTLDDLLADPTGDLQDILLYHTLSAAVTSDQVQNGLIANTASPTNTLKLTRTQDNMIFINQAEVIGADLQSGNGIVHVIDQVVLPVETVVDVAIDNGFDTLAIAAFAAELVPALSDPAATYTVFAPTDAAFGALGADLADLLNDPTGELQDILLYHVLDTEVLSSSLVDGQSAITLQGDELFVSINDDTVRINEAIVILPDVDADNGVVHVINQVLTPGFVSTSDVNGGQPQVAVYPNPTTSYLNIVLPSSDGNIVRFFNTNGQEVLQHQMAGNEATISLDGLSIGTYLMVIQDAGGKRHVQKISVQRQ